MAKTASDFLVERLYKWGIRRIYGYPGDGVNGIMEALNRASDKIRFIQSRHEELAAFEACAHAKYTGEVGVCVATSGPGAVHLLNGLYDAKLDSQPVVAIVGQQARNSLGADYQQEVDLISLFKDVAHEYVHMATTPAQIRQLADRAVRIAMAEMTVTCVIVPTDVQEMEAMEAPPRKHGSTFTGVGYSRPRVVPGDAELRRAVMILNECERPAILIGSGARGAASEVAQVADVLGAGVAKALLGKDVLPDDLPFVTGSIGLLGTKPSWDMMMNCDALFMIGSSFPYSEFLPKEGQARGVQIDIQPRKLGLRYPMDVNLEGDAALTLRALIPMLLRKTDRRWRAEIERNVREWWRIMEARAMLSADPVNPQRVFWELSPMLPDGAIIACDTGTSTGWVARDVKIRPGMRASFSGNLATMCPGIPYAVAAKFAYPERCVVAVVGDGAMQMIGNNELITIAHHWKEWQDPRLPIIVLNNGDLNQVTWEQRIMSASPEFVGSQSLPAFSYAKYADLLGLGGATVNRPENIGEALRAAFDADRPFLVDVICDPNVPPLPPHITVEQAKGFWKSFLKGDPHRIEFTEQSVKNMLASYLRPAKEPEEV